MQTELDALDPLLSIQIVGVNDVGFDSANDSMTDGRSLPWLQPKVGDEFWTLWQVTYRDVIILGSGNEHVGTFNLTDNDLRISENYAALRGQLLEAAGK